MQTFQLSMRQMPQSGQVYDAVADRELHHISGMITPQDQDCVMAVTSSISHLIDWQNTYILKTPKDSANKISEFLGIKEKACISW